MQVWEARILSLDFQSPRGLQTWSLGQYSSLWPLTHSDQLPGNFIFTVAVGWKVFFFSVLLLCSVFSSAADGGGSGQEWHLGSIGQGEDSENWIVGSENYQCSSSLSCQETTVICVGRSLPYSPPSFPMMSKSTGLEAAETKVFVLPLCNVTSVSGGCSLEGLSDVCCGKMTQFCLTPSGMESFQFSTGHRVKLIASETCHLLYWNVLPGWLFV